MLLAAWSSGAGTLLVVNLPATGTDAATGLNSASNYVCCLDFGNGAGVGCHQRGGLPARRSAVGPDRQWQPIALTAALTR